MTSHRTMACLFPHRLVVAVCLLFGCTAAVAFGQKDSASNRAGIELFEKKIRPVLVSKCYECHSADSEEVKAGLLLDHREAIRKGGETGPAVVPGKVEESLIIEALRHESFEMPPDEKLPEAVVADFVKWIELGAPDPREGTSVVERDEVDLEKGRQFWSFQPLRMPDVPAVKDSAWPRSDIDRYVLAKLEENGLAPAADAEPLVLLRRIYFDLIGLPPTPPEIDAFLSDCGIDRAQQSDNSAVRIPLSAIESVVDRLLASPHFGERWGRHWLDVARFAESSGGGRTRVFKDAWRYRDYVFDAFNKDKPYDEFIREQIAGDLLPYESPQERAEHFTATGFLVLGPTNYELQDKELLRMEVVDEQIDTTGRALLGMTLGCARCHDHKFDPVPTTDYYALAGIFRSTKTLTPGNVSGFETRELPVTGEKGQRIEQFEAKIADLEAQVKNARATADELKQQLPGAATGDGRKVASFDGIVIDDTQAELVGEWKSSTYNAGFVGKRYIHDDNAGKGEKSATFRAELPVAGEYEVRISYTASSNRASSVPVKIQHAGGEEAMRVDQRKALPADGSLRSLGKFRFENEAAVVISNEGTTSHVIADAVQWLPVGQTKLAVAKSEAAAGDSPEDDAAARQKAKQRAELIARLKPRIDEAEAEVQRLEKQLSEAKKKAPTQPVAMAVKEEGKPGDYFVCIRGNVHKLGDKVPRGFLSVATSQPPKIPADESGRRQLADWLADEQNPLTARVMVNRIWLHLFGQGIVRTPDNFGTTGEMPTHPQLLDHLARTFIEDGWSVKRAIRRIVLSRTYRMSSSASSQAKKVDPENRLLSHANRRRLEAEAIRDAILAVSGRLDTTYGGSSVANVGSEFGYKFNSVRRSVYVPVFRNTLHPLFEVFDVADPNLVSGRRNTSTLPTQALYMMNSPLVMDHARLAAERLLAESDLSGEERLRLLYRRALGRAPIASEQRLALAHLEEMTAEDTSNDEQRFRAWTNICQAVFASLDFRYVE